MSAAMHPNPGRLPADCEIVDDHGQVTGFRAVHVRLFNGHDTRTAGQSPWPSGGGRPPTHWRISTPPHPFDIRDYEVIR